MPTGGIDIPTITTVFHLPVHGLTFESVRSLPPEDAQRARMLFEENIKLNLVTGMGRDRRNIICRDNLYTRTMQEKCAHVLSGNTEELPDSVAEERALAKLEDAEPQAASSFVRFAARREGQIVGAMALYNMFLLSTDSIRNRWSAMMGPSLLSFGGAPWLDIWFDAIDVFLDVDMEDVNGDIHRCVEVRCPVDKPEHRWPEAEMSARIVARNMRYWATPSGLVTRITRASGGQGRVTQRG